MSNISTYNDYVVEHNGRPITSSRMVANRFKKRHSDVLRTVDNLDCSTNFNQRNFAFVKYSDQKGEQRREYQMTKDGFLFLVMGFTGKEAAKFKEEFIEAFNKMDEQIRSRILPKHEEEVNRLTSNNHALQFAYTELKSKYDEISWVNENSKFVPWIDYDELDYLYNDLANKKRKLEAYIEKLEGALRTYQNRNEKLEEYIHELHGYKSPILLSKNIATRRDSPTYFTEEFKRKVVKEFETTNQTKEALRVKYGIKGISTVLQWCRKYGDPKLHKPKTYRDK